MHTTPPPTSMALVRVHGLSCTAVRQLRWLQPPRFALSAAVLSRHLHGNRHHMEGHILYSRRSTFPRTRYWVGAQTVRCTTLTRGGGKPNPTQNKRNHMHMPYLVLPLCVPWAGCYAARHKHTSHIDHNSLYSVCRDYCVYIMYINHGTV